MDVQMVAAPVKPPCRLCRMWVELETHFPDSCTSKPLGLKNCYTLTWLRTWVHTAGASASFGAKFGCWGILVGVVVQPQCPVPTLVEMVGGPQIRHMAEAVWSRSPNLGASFLPAAEVNGSLGVSAELVFGNCSWEFSLNLFPKTFQWSLHPVESSSAYICYLNLLETNCWPCHDTVGLPGVVMGIWLEELACWLHLLSNDWTSRVFIWNSDSVFDKIMETYRNELRK